ncbi:MAG: hypothetical protein ABSG33_10120, partial [Candidatus Bathyarchaeia archaeon]
LALQSGKTKPKQTEPAAEKTIAPITDNNLNMQSTLKVASRQSESRNVQSASSPKPKKQPETQTATRESRNLSVAKVAT